MLVRKAWNQAVTVCRIGPYERIIEKAWTIFIELDV